MRVKQVCEDGEAPTPAEHSRSATALVGAELSDLDKKAFKDFQNQRFNAFGRDTIVLQETNVLKLREQLIKNLRARKTFSERHDFLDARIQYDQRFFQDGHSEFQVLISDIRKQIRLNEEVLRLKS
jgi:hypothetical protein